MAEQASNSASKRSPSTRQPPPSGSSSAMRRLSSMRAPWADSQAAAGRGKSSDRPTRGSSRSEPPAVPNSASPSTRRNTVALAWSAGVFIAATHNGSISCSRTRFGSAAHKAPTVSTPGLRMPCLHQLSDVCNSASRSPSDQPRAPSTPRANPHSAGPGATFSPCPSGYRNSNGRRLSSFAVSAPTRPMTRCVAV